MKNQPPQLIVALDVDTLEEARSLIDKLSPVVDIFKVGSQLFTSCGPVAVRFIQARGKKVFLDLKYHDIPNTVANAVHVAMNLSSAINSAEKDPHVRPGVFMYTLHTQGGAEMLTLAAETTRKEAQLLKIEKPFVVGVTVLTSEARKDNLIEVVLERARLAKSCGLDGVVASCEEARTIRKELGKDFLIVTPGIRPAGMDAGDQKRIATPRDAIASGSNFLVVGRPIIKAENPLKASQRILNEMKSF